VIALLVGTVLAVAVLAFVLFPLLRDGDGVHTRATPRDQPELRMPATDAEPVSDDEVEAALAAYRLAVTVCPVCGPRPEHEPLYCSNCGRKL
jgi:hypothetical protein